VLDEPTNHLDVESIDALLQALVDFKGTVVVTSHDRHFIGKLSTRVLELSHEGPRLFNGTYEEFLDRFGAEHLKK
jgi:ATPase subunit of ABC transporter with duplicated ATPase domains